MERENFIEKMDIMVYNYRKLIETVAKKYGLYGPDFRIIDIILNNDECNQVFIAKQLGVSKATTGVFLIRLEKSGFIKRVMAYPDTRSKNAKVTAKGKSAHKAMERILNNLTENMFADFNRIDEFFDNSIKTLKEELLSIEKRGRRKMVNKKEAVI